MFRKGKELDRQNENEKVVRRKGKRGREKKKCAEREGKGNGSEE